MEPKFDLTKFVAELSKSTNICAGAKADIQRAADAASGKVTRTPQVGEIWRYTGSNPMSVTSSIRLIVRDGQGIKAATFAGELTSSAIIPQQYEFESESLQQYLNDGGKL